MAIFRQYVPTALIRLGMAPDSIEFQNTEEFLSHPMMQRLAALPKFSHFAINGIYVIAVGDQGFLWHAIGSVDTPEALHLPQWAGWKYRALLDDGTRTVLTGDDIAVCDAPFLTLRDGRGAIIVSE